MPGYTICRPRYSTIPMTKLKLLSNFIGRQVTGRLRVLPDFIIIGAQRCGTTSLYEYLLGHPDIRGAARKEVHFYDVHFRNGVNWYRSFFPLRSEKARHGGAGFVAGEASPYYLFHPHVPRRIQQVTPQARFIVILRNPVDRAYSQFHFNTRRGKEGRSFEEALAYEEQVAAAEIAKLAENEHYRSRIHRDALYLHRGIYADQLQNWFGCFPREQFLILKTEDLEAQPQETLDRVFAFLGVAAQKLDVEARRYNQGSYHQLDPVLRARLEDFFRPHNQRLYDDLGIDFGW